MKYEINRDESDIVRLFQSLQIPSIFKLDKTDRILFAEDLRFPICDWLLKGKSISDIQYDDLMIDYERFIKDTDVKEFDDFALNYYNICLQVIKIVQKYQGR